VGEGQKNLEEGRKRAVLVSKEGRKTEDVVQRKTNRGGCEAEGKGSRKKGSSNHKYGRGKYSRKRTPTRR